MQKYEEAPFPVLHFPFPAHYPSLARPLSMPKMLFSRFPTCLRAAAMLAMLSLSCRHLASGHACVRAILLCGLGDWGLGLVWGCVIDVVWM